jgi:hypothetical protein
VSQETKQDVIRSDRAEKPTVVLSRFESARNPVDPGDPSLDDLVDPVQMEGSEGEARASRVGVDDDGVRRPFMLGILVHSLTESGLSFEDAYAISRQIWGRIQDRMLVTKQELRELVAELAGAGRVAVPDETATPALGGPLEVLGSNGRWPFNQTRIQQSFLAAGLEPARAFELVSEIEWRLRGLGSAVEISRSNS